MMQPKRLTQQMVLASPLPMVILPGLGLNTPLRQTNPAQFLVITGGGDVDGDGVGLLLGEGVGTGLVLGEG